MGSSEDLQQGVVSLFPRPLRQHPLHRRLPSADLRGMKKKTMKRDQKAGKKRMKRMQMTEVEMKKKKEEVEEEGESHRVKEEEKGKERKKKDQSLGDGEPQGNRRRVGRVWGLV